MSKTLICVAALFAALSSRASSQVPDPSLLFRDRLILAQPYVIASPDVGFRIIRWDGEIPVGQIVVKVNGAWIAAETAE